jgi:two-component system, chemotaxis family, response regulator Rcp1
LDNAVEGDRRMSSNVVGRPMEILMVEDSLMFARITMGALRNGRVEHRMTWLQDGEDALDFLQRNGRFKRAPLPDMILLDLGLPRLDGRELLARVKDDERLRVIPIVVMTASTSDEDRIATERLEVAAYLTKPVNLDQFLQLVRQLRHYWREDMILPTVA